MKTYHFNFSFFFIRRPQLWCEGRACIKLASSRKFFPNVCPLLDPLVPIFIFNFLTNCENFLIYFRLVEKFKFKKQFRLSKSYQEFIIGTYSKVSMQTFITTLQENFLSLNLLIENNCKGNKTKTKNVRGQKLL